MPQPAVGGSLGLLGGALCCCYYFSSPSSTFQLLSAVPFSLSFIEFMKKAFDAVETERIEGPGGAVMHAEVKIGDSHIMLGQARDQYKPMPTCLYVYVEDMEALYKSSLAAGEKRDRPLTRRTRASGIGVLLSEPERKLDSAQAGCLRQMLHRRARRCVVRHERIAQEYLPVG